MSISPGNDMIKIESVECKDGIASVTFSIPFSLFPQFNQLFSSLLSIFRYSQIKANHVQVKQRVESKRFKEMYQNQYKAFEAECLKRFDKYIASGQSTREAIRSTKLEYVKKGHEVTCYQIELICRGNGRLSKKWGKNA